MKINLHILIPLLFLLACNKDENENTSLNFEINKIFIDHNGTKWFATDQGLYNLKSNQLKKHTEVPTNEISDLAYQSSSFGDELWLANNGGAVVAAYDIDAITSATIYTVQNSELINDTVTSIALDNNNARWIATSNGISVFKGSSWYDTTVNLFKKNKINSIAGDNSGWMFFASEGSGVFRFKLEVDGITGASIYESDWSSGILSNNVNFVLIDGNDQWYGTAEGASRHTCFLAKECWETFTTDDGLISNNVTSIAKGNDGKIYFGTDKGISVYNGSEFSSYTTEDGLISNEINCIAVDIDGSLWFGTNQGVSHKSVDGTWTNYTE